MAENKSRIAAQVMLTISIFLVAVIKYFFEKNESTKALDVSLEWLQLAGFYVFIFLAILVRNIDTAYLRMALYLNLALSGLAIIYISQVTTISSNFGELVNSFFSASSSIILTINYLILPPIIFGLAVLGKK